MSDDLKAAFLAATKDGNTLHFGRLTSDQDYYLYLLHNAYLTSDLVPRKDVERLVGKATSLLYAAADILDDFDGKHDDESAVLIIARYERLRSASDNLRAALASLRPTALPDQEAAAEAHEIHRLSGITQADSPVTWAEVLGYDELAAKVTCPTCGGSGQIDAEPLESLQYDMQPCPTCHGEGSVTT